MFSRFGTIPASDQYTDGRAVRPDDSIYLSSIASRDKIQHVVRPAQSACKSQRLRDQSLPIFTRAAQAMRG